jgi:hypothetical protein
MKTTTLVMIASLRAKMNQLSVTMADKENFVADGGYNEDAERAMQLVYIEALKLVGLMGKALTAPLEETAIRELLERAIAVSGKIDRLTA